MITQLDLLSAKTQRDDGIRRARDHASDRFRMHAEAAVYQACKELPELIVDSAWARMPPDVGTHDARAMGAVMLYAVRQGWLEKTDRFLPSAQPACHQNPRRVWRSKLYQP